MIKLVSNAKSFLMMAPYPLPPRNVLLVSTGGNWHQKKSNATFIVNRDHCDISDSSNVITIRFYSGCSGKCITLVSTVSSLVTFKTTSLNWMPLVMRQLILVWSIFRSNPRHLMVIIQFPIREHPQIVLTTCTFSDMNHLFFLQKFVVNSFTEYHLFWPFQA